MKTAGPEVMKLIAALLVVSVALVCADPWDVVNSNISVHFAGQSGQVTVRRVDDTKGSTTVTLQFDKLEEWDANNNTLSPPVAIALPTQSFVWAAPVIVNYQGYNATELTLTASLSNGGTFQATAYIFFEDAQVTDGNNTYTVLTDHCKLTFTVTNWPFKATSDYLVIGALLKYKGGAKGDPTDIKDKDSKEKTIVFGGGSIDVANTATLDGVSQPVTPTLYSKSAGANKFVGIQLQFPSFKNTLVYDPSIGISGAFAVTPSRALLLAIVLALFALTRL